MQPTPKQRGVLYRGVNVALQAAPGKAGTGRFVGTCIVVYGALSRRVVTTSEEYDTEEQALAAIRRRVPYIVEEMFRNGDLPEP